MTGVENRIAPSSAHRYFTSSQVHSSTDLPLPSSPPRLDVNTYTVVRSSRELLQRTRFSQYSVRSGRFNNSDGHVLGSEAGPVGFARLRSTAAATRDRITFRRVDEESSRAWLD